MKERKWNCSVVSNSLQHHGLPGSSVHGIFQVRILEWAAISSSRRSSQPRDWTPVSHIVGRRFTIRAHINAKNLTCIISLLWGNLDLNDAFKLWGWRRLESPSDCKEIKPVNPKGNQPWIFYVRTDAQAPILRTPDVKSWLIGKKTWCWERLKTEGEGGNREWNGWMASPAQWTWVWASSRRWRRTGKLGVL